MDIYNLMLMRTRARIDTVDRPARELTWRLLGGEGERYDAAWGNYGRDWIRNDHGRLYLLEAGAISLETADGNYVLEPGTLWLIPGGVSARYRCVKPMHLNWVHFNVFVIPEIDLLRGGPPRAMPADAASVKSFHAMLLAARTNEPMALATAIAVLGQMVAPFFSGNWDTLLPEASGLQRLRPAIDRISSQFAGDCSVDALAACVNLHPVYFSRLFKRTLGVSPARYVTEVRMRRAAIRLTSTDLPVKAIGIECGYADPYHFSRAFKHHTGVSPQAYRLAHSACAIQASTSSSR
jgi:AraC family transcriptional regulator, arabinose operon regulatory protein